MPRLPKKRQGVTEKQMMFVRSYLQTFDLKEACRHVNVTTTTGNRWLKLAKIRTLMKSYVSEDLKESKLQREDVLLQLYYQLTRDIADLVDEDGIVIDNLHDMPERIRQCINGFEVNQRFDEDGKISAQQIKVKLTDKMAAIELARKHVWGIDMKEDPNSQVENLNWDNMYEPAQITDQSGNIVDGLISGE